VNVNNRPFEEVTLAEVDARLLKYLAQMQYLLAKQSYAEEIVENFEFGVAGVDLVPF